MDTQRIRGGHDFLPPDDILSQIPPLYGTENTPPEDKPIFIHYFGPSSDHYVVELSQREEGRARAQPSRLAAAGGTGLLVDAEPFRLVLKERS